MNVPFPGHLRDPGFNEKASPSILSPLISFLQTQANYCHLCHFSAFIWHFFAVLTAQLQNKTSVKQIFGFADP
jgi:hypothetical protein